MKKLEFKTSKGSFMLVDSIEIEGIKLSEITEEQASEIVDKKIGYKNYLESTDVISNYSCVTATKSLHSLIKSKGAYLYENPHNTVEAEQKTFYNPVIFKL